MRRPTPPKQVDASGQCRHLYLTREATCVHCGMRFRLTWTAPQRWIVFPSARNGAITVMLVLLMAAAGTLGIGVATPFLLAGAVAFGLRAGLGGMELFMRHQFTPGVLGRLQARSPINILAPKRHLGWVGAVRFPMDPALHARFAEGDTLLVEYLRWSRLPVAVYRGELPG